MEIKYERDKSKTKENILATRSSLQMKTKNKIKKRFWGENCWQTNQAG